MIADDEIYQTQIITVAVPIYGANRGLSPLEGPVKGLRILSMTVCL